jgi:transposase
MQITTIGIDLAKPVFQLHGVDAEGKVVLKKKLRRGAVLNFLCDLPPCLIGRRRVRPPTIGHARPARLATRCV